MVSKYLLPYREHLSKLHNVFKYDRSIVEQQAHLHAILMHDLTLLNRDLFIVCVTCTIHRARDHLTVFFYSSVIAYNILTMLR